ncbi:AlpA family transcriptional regulator [Actinoplanes sp. M2I2]|uniref:helix-turn-helix transcriptional regulator n=1 Tax=Actinoplanes sp. M2I2 TaxID=1734444 RepID=UPI0020222006|nr:helix-turn-helix domain-containing protein [Actinoplanes sp. M2I2]
MSHLPYWGRAEIAERLGVHRSKAYRLTLRPDFPEPAARLSTGDVWRIDAVENWAAEHWSPDGPPSP